jgi:hypothetical protein
MHLFLYRRKSIRQKLLYSRQEKVPNLSMLAMRVFQLKKAVGHAGDVGMGVQLFFVCQWSMVTLNTQHSKLDKEEMSFMPVRCSRGEIKKLFMFSFCFLDYFFDVRRQKEGFHSSSFFYSLEHMSENDCLLGCYLYTRIVNLCLFPPDYCFL